MNYRAAIVFASLLAPHAIVPAVHAHEVANMQHSHAFEQTGYGQYRQGHAVNGPQGDIVIWSPRTHGSYQARPPVNFARPEPISRPPQNPFLKPEAGKDPARDYGKQHKRDYGG